MAFTGALAALFAAGETVRPAMTQSQPGPRVSRRLRPGSHTVQGTFNKGIKARKRQIPKGRKHRVRLRAALRGDVLRRPLTAFERGWL